VSADYVAIRDLRPGMVIADARNAKHVGKTVQDVQVSPHGRVSVTFTDGTLVRHMNVVKDDTVKVEVK
jgi:hypothetical protein